MTIKTNAQGSERKRMALVISKWTGHPVKYAGAPTFNYEIGGIVIDRNAGIDIGNRLPDEATDRLVQHLINEGFGIEGFTTSAEATADEPEAEEVACVCDFPMTVSFATSFAIKALTPMPQKGDSRTIQPITSLNTTFPPLLLILQMR